MTDILLDTHVLLWALLEPHKLSSAARAVIADRNTALYVSAASAWEISTKHRLGRLPDAAPVVLAFDDSLERLGAVAVPVTSRHALAAGALNWPHGDPFDRILAAQCLLDGLPLMTADRAFPRLPGVRLIAAR